MGLEYGAYVHRVGGLGTGEALAVPLELRRLPRSTDLAHDA